MESSRGFLSEGRAALSDLNSLVYEIVEGKTASSLDRVRRGFFNLFYKMEGENSPVEITEIGNAVAFHTGMDISFLNQVTIFDSSAEIFEKVMQLVASWKVKNQVYLAGAGLAHAEQLKLTGYTCGGAAPFMGYAIDDRFANFELREGLSVVLTKTESELDGNIKMISDTFGLPKEVVSTYAGTLLADPTAFRYMLFDKGVPVSTSIFMKNEMLVGCFDVATPAEHQRKGYGEELMKYMLRVQYELGSKLVVLQASPAGEVLYRRMGFQIIEYVQQWDMNNQDLIDGADK